MSHDIEASYATAEVARLLLENPQICFGTPPERSSLSTFASREGRNAWPHADGVIELATAEDIPSDYSIAVEFKRPNEGVHGILTAIGQTHAYLKKGYPGAIMIVPDMYPNLSNTGRYLNELIEQTSRATNIGVFTYTKPDLSKISPFHGTITSINQFRIDGNTDTDLNIQKSTNAKTQWAHVREGSTEPDPFFKYLQSVKLLSGGGEPHLPDVPDELASAVLELRPESTPINYLSNCRGQELADKAWRHFWFKFVLKNKALVGWEKNDDGVFSVRNTESNLEKSDGRGKKLFFVGKSNSIKNKLVSWLNAGRISETEASKILAQNFSDRAHSYREDIDSGCEHFGFVDDRGWLTDLGFKFVNACERYGNPNEGIPRSIFLNAVLENGKLGAFLHYIYRLSEAVFREDPLRFSTINNGRTAFDSKEYLQWLETEMADTLRVLRKVSRRTGNQRKPFQAELALLRRHGIVDKKFRTGIGMVINWPSLQKTLNNV